jgi:hypothetical protein
MQPTEYNRRHFIKTQKEMAEVLKITDRYVRILLAQAILPRVCWNKVLSGTWGFPIKILPQLLANFTRNSRSFRIDVHQRYMIQALKAMKDRGLEMGEIFPTLSPEAREHFDEAWAHYLAIQNKRA